MTKEGVRRDLPSGRLCLVETSTSWAKDNEHKCRCQTESEVLWAISHSREVWQCGIQTSTATNITITSCVPCIFTQNEDWRSKSHSGRIAHYWRSRKPWSTGSSYGVEQIQSLASINTLGRIIEGWGDMERLWRDRAKYPHLILEGNDLLKGRENVKTLR